MLSRNVRDLLRTMHTTYKLSCDNVALTTSLATNQLVC
jgi:hypothetical protein